jgi:hypothetical protein
MKIDGRAEDGDLNQDGGGNKTNSERKQHYTTLFV